LNGEDHYTIFDVPISVTNKIDFTGNNPPCDSVNNLLLAPEEIDATSANTVGILFAPGDATYIEQTGVTGLNGLGGGLGSPSWSKTASWLAATCLFFVLFT